MYRNMSIINNFDCFNEIKQELVSNMKTFLLLKEILLFVTTDDSLLQYKLRDKSLKLLKQFNDKKFIIKLVSSESCSMPHFMLLTDNGQIYSWGYNEYGQLGHGTIDDCEKPKFIESFSDMFIINVCCGSNHSLVLLRNGDVYAFGSNNFGECANDNSDNNYKQLKPFKISLPKIIAISCGLYHSIALTEMFEVYFWGLNYVRQIYIPTKLELPKINQIMCGQNTIIFLSENKNIYFCDIKSCYISKFLVLNQLQSNSITKFIKIAATIDSNLFVALSNENKCYIYGEFTNKNSILQRDRENKFGLKKRVLIKNLQETIFNSIEETFAFYEQITFNNIHIRDSKTINYFDCFTEITLLGTGGFSAVFKSVFNFDRNIYAIKKISFEPENRQEILKELMFLTKHKSKFIVYLYDYWIEDNYYLDTEKNLKIQSSLYNTKRSNLLHMQMELCSLTLLDAINIIEKECKTSENTLSLIGYYICSELYFEILECVQYLHSQNPKIIHRDLKPENILLTNFVNNRFVKLSDFGLSTFHEFADQSHTKYKGTFRYRAPELNINTKYTTKVDQFSLGIILQELFCININDLTPIYYSPINGKMNYMVGLIKKLTNYFPIERPDCDILLSQKRLWCLSKEELLSDEAFRLMLSVSPKPESIKENLIEYIIHKMFELDVERNRIHANYYIRPHIRQIIPQ